MNRRSFLQSIILYIFNHAKRILEEDQIIARPVYDESLLNRTRLHVVWLSPNEWFNGSLYGNIRFHLNWNRIIEHKKFYWVEVKKYSTHAPRLLIAHGSQESILSIDTKITLYDPLTDKGPLKLINNEWFWNNQITLEVMVKDDIYLDFCTRVDVIKHHPNICRIYGGSCDEKKRDRSASGAELLAYLLGADCRTIDDQLTTSIGPPEHPRYHHDLMYPVLWLQNLLFDNVEFGGSINVDSEIRSVIFAACSQIAHRQKISAKQTMSLISSQKAAKINYEKIIQRHFRLKKTKLLLN